MTRILFLHLVSCKTVTDPSSLSAWRTRSRAQSETHSRQQTIHYTTQTYSAPSGAPAHSQNQCTSSLYWGYTNSAASPRRAPGLILSERLTVISAALWSHYIGNDTEASGYSVFTWGATSDPVTESRRPCSEQEKLKYDTQTHHQHR